MRAKGNFNILLPYKEKTVLATVYPATEPNHYAVKFPGGYTNIFFPVSTNGRNANLVWAERKLGVTELSKEVGKILNKYLSSAKHIEPFILTVNGNVYLAQHYS